MKRHFDPVAIFPSRIAGEPWKAISTQALPPGVRGATNIKEHVAYIPVANNAYERHVRYHESLHGLYTKHSEDKKEYALRSQALEDCRLHLLHSQAKGTVRRDELTAVLRDMHNGMKLPDDPMSAVIGVRAAAHLYADGVDKTPTRSMENLLDRYCQRLGKDFKRDAMDTLDCIRLGDHVGADIIMAKYIPDGDEALQQIAVLGMWPGMGKGNTPESADDVPSFEFTPDQGEASAGEPGKGGETAAESKFKHKMPTLYIHKLYAIDNVKTFTGARDKRCLSGLKIKASKLASVIGPGNPRIFERVIHRDGGTVLIDASGSMELDPNDLLEILAKAPFATIAMYNSQHDAPSCPEHNFGNMWIFSHNAKRAADFNGIRFNTTTRRITTKRGRAYPRDMWDGGNLVDYPAMMWLLSQAGPRYMLTDCQWTGDSDNIRSCQALFERSVARKKIIHAGTDLDELKAIFARRGRKLA